MSGPFGTYALALFDAGLGEVFPLNGKTAFLRGVHGQYDPPITREMVVRWVEQYPDCNVGLIPADGLVEVDVDQHDEKHGAEELAAALGVTRGGLGRLLRGTVHVTARPDLGGWSSAHGHWLFRAPSGTRLKHTVPGVSVEIIGPGRRGFYVAAPGSVHPTTARAYTADVNGSEVAAEDLTLDLVQPMPEELLALFRDDAPERPQRPSGGGSWADAAQWANDPDGAPDEAVQRVLDAYLDDLGTYGDAGTHHEAALAVQRDLVNLAQRGAVGVGTALDEASGAAVAYFDSVGRDGESEWARGLDGVDVDLDRMRRGSETGDYSPEPSPVGVLNLADFGLPSLAATEEGFWNSRPVLRDLRDFARARRVAPWALLGCVLARVAGYVGPWIVLPPLVGGDGSLNVFVAVCGLSGGGKTAAMAAARDFLIITSAVDCLETGVGSGEGLLAAYVRNVPAMRATKDREAEPARTEVVRSSVLFVADEVQGLGALMGRTNSTLGPFLKSAWAGALLGTANANEALVRRLDPHTYRTVLVAGVQPEHAGVILDDVGGGFPQRWSWFSTYDPAMLGRGEQVLEPEPYEWRVPEPPAGATGPGQPISAAGGDRFRMSVPAAVRDAVYDALEARNRPIGSAAADSTLDGHAVFAREKVAALLALLDGRLSVTEADWRLSGVIARHSDHTRGEVMKARAVEAAREADHRAERTGKSAAIARGAEDQHHEDRVRDLVRKRLESEPGEWISKSDLGRHVGGRNRAHLDGALCQLVGSGLAEEREAERNPTGRGGGGGRQFRVRPQ